MIKDNGEMDKGMDRILSIERGSYTPPKPSDNFKKLSKRIDRSNERSRWFLEHEQRRFGGTEKNEEKKGMFRLIADYFSQEYQKYFGRRGSAEYGNCR